MGYGDRLKNLRSAKDISQQELADRLQINRSTYARYELGRTQPDFDTLEKIADFFQVTTDYIIKGTENNVAISDLSEDEKEMLEFFNDPETGLFFREMKEAPEDQLEEIKQIWEVLKKRGLK